MEAIRWLSASAAVATFVVIVLGKIVRVTGASTSIPDWPLAHGKLVPKFTRLVFWEWIHRVAVLLTVLLVVALLVAAILLGGRLWIWCAISLFLVVATAVLGGISVLKGENLVVAALDQAFAMLFFASLVGLAVWVRAAAA